MNRKNRRARPLYQIMRRRSGLAPVADRHETHLGLPHLEDVWPEVCQRCDCAHCRMLRATDVVDVDGSNIRPL